MATREAYQRQYQAQLRLWDAGVKDWKAKAFHAKAALRPVYEGELKNLGEQRALAQKRLNELVNHEEDAWESLQVLAEEAWLALRTATEKAGAVFGSAHSQAGKP